MRNIQPNDVHATVVYYVHDCRSDPDRAPTCRCDNIHNTTATRNLGYGAGGFRIYRRAHICIMQFNAYALDIEPNTSPNTCASCSAHITHTMDGCLRFRSGGCATYRVQLAGRIMVLCLHWLFSYTHVLVQSYFLFAHIAPICEKPLTKIIVPGRIWKHAVADE